MTAKAFLLDFCNGETKKTLLNYRSASELLSQPIAAVAMEVDPVKPVPAVEVVGVCEFVGDYALPGSSGRLCFDGTFCPVRVYGHVEFYCTCPTRKQKNKEKRKSV
jgi:hypothetical protein